MNLKSTGMELKKNVKEMAKNIKKDDVKEALYSAKNMAWNEIHNLGESFMPVLKDSSQFENGVLTPEQFVISGNRLISNSGCWTWGYNKDEYGHKNYLPATQQFLISRGVSCEKRVSEIEKTSTLENIIMDTNGWSNILIESGTGINSEANDDISDGTLKSKNLVDELIEELQEEKRENRKLYSKTETEIEDETVEVDEMNGFEDLTIEQDEFSVNNFVSCRRYDISITYDNYYRTPRVWLQGRNEFGTPMNHHEIYEDIMSEYKNRTVTLERHPYFKGGLHVSIHPCKHAETMKTFIKMSGLRPEDYMFTFLKFIQSIVPTINYDFTQSVLLKKIK